ncbi:putative RNA polymerase II transcriptional coactivator [Golovinomyces cichoracearum]|uniref:Putative RNA polymerase II transcriptional coactivator n=1 Tax=Golovinomyces cichoracearum TaxID=62708 RepID=A0A420J0P2_9PEZI|nr:putative RNA polymerase II transcriptional coactivator [Golovinomyces cichoracearum]
MVKSNKRVRSKASKYESDDGSVETDGTAPKKQKSDNKAKTSWELSDGKQPRRVEVTEFKGAHLINIREFYQKDGQYLPGKKGISLNIDQYKAFIHAVPAINAHLQQLGVEISTPIAKNGSGEKSKSDAHTGEKECSEKQKKALKANIDTTSDENEDDE